jgi:hypothetical protein
MFFCAVCWALRFVEAAAAAAAGDLVLEIHYRVLLH